ncbi:hypothetical protein DFH07DRAFT_764728 [Mycena maculata]|uniref:Mid2 domain-containing protein n=1 Tax=Mycena maculata TaxID=230809 RepID=A0AAD7NZN5_9AGAR|nr:hypothetical protein DFH07DRAFT_764728 [Mycena maculata]
MLASLLVLGVVALGPQVVLGSFKFSLSPVVQCQPVQIAFSGSDSNNHSVPTTLTILPLADNTAPIQISIPNGASNSTGIQLTFIPLPSGTEFLASLDALQESSATVSDVTGVAVSNNSTASANCLESTNSIPQVSFYEFDDIASQCEPFTITYHTSTAPNVTAFSPKGGTTPIMAGNNSEAPPNTASYIMNVQRQDEVVLLFDDGEGHAQTTKLITIGGDSTSSQTCFNKTKSAKWASDNDSVAPSNSLSQGAVIGIAVAASLVGLFAILGLLYYMRARRRKHRVTVMAFDPYLLNRRWPPDEKKVDMYQTPPPFTAPPPFSGGPFADPEFVRDPIYTNEKYAASIMSDARTSIGSWNQFVPEDQRSQRTESVVSSSPEKRNSSASTLSMNTVDIQNILQMATVHRDRSGGSDSGIAHQAYTPEQPQPSTAGTAMTTFALAKPAVARLLSTRRKRTASDMDMPISAVSRNNSATAAAITGVPSGYGPTSYMSMSYNGDNDDDVLPTTAGHGVDGIGGFPIPPAFNPERNPRDTGESWGNVR